MKEERQGFMRKKLGLILLCLLMALGIMGLSGCKEKAENEKENIGSESEEEAKEPEYSSLGEVKQPANAEEASYGGFSAQYDKDKWAFDARMGQFAIYDKSDYESNSEALDNINVRISADFEGTLKESDMNTLMNQLNLMGATTGFKVKSNEMKTFEGEPVIYYEAETKLTDEMLDLLIEDGSVTEADIEAMGGREYLINLPASKQIGINAVVDGKIITVTGTYKDSPDEMIEAMKLLIKTGKIQ